MMFIPCAEVHLKYQDNIIIALGFYEEDFSLRVVVYYDETNKTIRREIASEGKFMGKIEKSTSY